MADFKINKKYKIRVSAIAGAGLVCLLISLFSSGFEASRFWSNILLNNVMFAFIGLFGVFFIAISVLGDSKWYKELQQILKSMSSFIPIAGILMLIMLFGAKHIFEWLNPDAVPHEYIHKLKYLNLPFFTIRMLVYFAGWIGLSYLLFNSSTKQKSRAALFVVFFAISSSMCSWDWLMSTDISWHSSIFGWYIFAGIFVSGISILSIVTILLKANGNLPKVTGVHIKEISRYLFTFSCIWMYLWLSQYILIWYGNLPEETSYFITRMENYSVLFWLIVIINFVVPFFALISKKAKENKTILLTVSILCIVGHWLNYYILIFPGTMKNTSKIGIMEVGISLIYLSLFAIVLLIDLSKKTK